MPRKQTVAPRGKKPARIAQGIVEGKSYAAIGREEGVSREAIRRQANSTDVRQILVSLVNAQSDRLHLIFASCLSAIEDALQADRVVTDREGNAIDLGHDHYARLQAVKRFIELTTAGRPLPKPTEESEKKTGITVQELERLHQELNSNHATQ